MSGEYEGCGEEFFESLWPWSKPVDKCGENGFFCDSCEMWIEIDKLKDDISLLKGSGKQ